MLLSISKREDWSLWPRSLDSRAQDAWIVFILNIYNGTL